MFGTGDPLILLKVGQVDRSFQLEYVKRRAFFNEDYTRNCLYIFYIFLVSIKHI